MALHRPVSGPNHYSLSGGAGHHQSSFTEKDPLFPDPSGEGPSVCYCAKRNLLDGSGKRGASRKAKTFSEESGEEYGEKSDAVLHNS